MAALVVIDPHARERIAERGTTEDEVTATVEGGESVAGGRYSTKQVEVFAIEEDGRWVVVTVIVKFF